MFATFHLTTVSNNVRAQGESRELLHWQELRLLSVSLKFFFSPQNDAGQELSIPFTTFSNFLQGRTPTMPFPKVVRL